MFAIKMTYLMWIFQNTNKNGEWFLQQHQILLTSVKIKHFANTSILSCTKYNWLKKLEKATWNSVSEIGSRNPTTSSKNAANWSNRCWIIQRWWLWLILSSTTWKTFVAPSIKKFKKEYHIFEVFERRWNAYCTS